MSTYSLAPRKPAFALNLPPTLYVSGSSVRGEVELNYELVFEDEIDCIFVQLLGRSCTKNRKGAQMEQFEEESNEFLRVQLKLWTRLRSAPPRDRTDVVRLPFELQIPPDAPPSFGFESYLNNAHVRYAVDVTGVRGGAFAMDRAVKVPVVVVAPDPIGSAVRSQLKLGWQNDWGRLKVEAHMRKFPWGEHARATMELLVPHVDTFPLFTPIPFSIIISTLSAPVKRKALAPAPRDLFPPLPRGPSELEFELRRLVDMWTPQEPSKPEGHVADILSKAHLAVPPVEVEIGPHIWVPDRGHPDRGRWRQEATFHSSMDLRCTPTFLTEEIKIKYTLILRVVFPGLGNVLRIELPINIGSGMETSLPVDRYPQPPRIVDLPASYWNPQVWEEK